MANKVANNDTKNKGPTVTGKRKEPSSEFDEGGRAWVLEDKNEYDGGFAHGLFNHDLRKKTVKEDGTVVWDAHTLGFYEDEHGQIPLIKSNIPENRMFHLSRPVAWRPELGELILGWKVIDNEPPGAWWIGRVVRMEWHGLFDGESDTIYTIQWLVYNGWEPDSSEWDKLRLVCLLPFPEKLQEYVKPYM
eukprot:CAMPEP_0174350154 /NCGR_PEP_ID=MMETSP0811_2-20130205/7155_1 /TAXON_ID=73025 ORGANISM="Eutreptiella gymnastica-like, Strain CCMP1594" /NCGR_SAMPLE_ID=MMETSP0811_2 /ASSEMBLY_ACC=CAM_ASM_000667 /LENGTH=189 /DNA_ID=CAMNT_0015478205 /DNA_START=20 /DNA_END=589 /DNA_ORIENTATION=+